MSMILKHKKVAMDVRNDTIRVGTTYIDMSGKGIYNYRLKVKSRNGNTIVCETYMATPGSKEKPYKSSHNATLRISDRLTKEYGEEVARNSEFEIRAGYKA